MITICLSRPIIIDKTITNNIVITMWLLVTPATTVITDAFVHLFAPTHLMIRVPYSLIIIFLYFEQAVRVSALQGATCQTVLL